MAPADPPALAVRPGPLLGVLAALTALAPFSVDVYTPSLPRIQADLGGADWVIQASITSGLLGIAVGQLYFGPLSDRVGRLTVFRIGITGVIIASALSAIAPTAWALVGARGATGLFGAAGIVAARSAVRDVSRSPAVVGGRIALLAMLSAAAPVVAPIVGAGIAHIWGWRADFVTLAVGGCVIAVGLGLFVPETLPPGARRSTAPLASTLGDAFRDRELRLVAISLFAQAFGFYAYIAAAAFITEREYHHGATAFAVVFGSNAAAMFAANLVFRRLVRNHHPKALVGVGLCTAGVGGLMLLGTAAVRGPEAVVWAASAVFAAGTGFVLPGAHSWAQATRPPSGAASALTGAAQFLGGVFGSPVTGAVGPTALLLGGIITVSSVLALVTWYQASRVGPHLAAPRSKGVR